MMDYEIKQSFINCEHFIGVFSRNNLPNKVYKRPCGLILNTDKVGDPGTHWVAIVFLKDKKGEYFDSFGFPPLYSEIKDYLNDNCENGWIYNPVTLQHSLSVSCGNYCVAFLKSRFNNHSFLKFVNSFGSNLKKNELILKNGLQNVWIHVR